MRRLCTLILALVLVQVVSAATIFVPGSYSTIQAGIDAASSGDTVYVEAGTYVENITLKSGVRVMGEGADVTKINGNDTGRAVTCIDCSNITRLNGFTITGGDADLAGGMYNLNSTAVIKNCIFKSNTANNGGGVINENASVTIIGCTFTNNSSDWGGGILNRDGSEVTISDCTITENTSTTNGGGIRNMGGSVVTITNCTIKENLTTEDYAGGVYCANRANVTITDCTLSRNFPENIFGSGGYTDGGGNYIDERIYVDEYGKPAHYRYVQDAIDAAVDGDTIVVMPGRHYATLNMLGKAITLQSSDPTDADVISSTLLDGGYKGTVITCNSGETADTVITGFVITRGNGTEVTEDSNVRIVGGGMLNNQSSPTITNCTFSKNALGQPDERPFGYGGGMYNHESSPTITNCTFISNYASYTGGAIYNKDSSSPIITNCNFFSNVTGQTGSGINSWGYCTVELTNCKFYGHDNPTLWNAYYSEYIYNGVTFDFCPPPSFMTDRIPGDIDASGTVDLEDFAIIANPLRAVAILAENWLERAK